MKCDTCKHKDKKQTDKPCIDCKYCYRGTGTSYYEKEKKACHMCGSELSTAKCSTCGKYVCDDSTKCSETLNHGDDLVCNECLSKQEKCDCSKCKTAGTEDCPFQAPAEDDVYVPEFAYVYDCPEYVELEEMTPLEAFISFLVTLDEGGYEPTMPGFQILIKNQFKHELNNVESALKQLASIKETIIEYAKKHNFENMMKDYNGICHFLMYLRQDGWETHANFARDVIAQIIEMLFTDYVPPMVKLNKFDMEGK